MLYQQVLGEPVARRATHRWLLVASFSCLLIAAPELALTPALAQQTTGTPGPPDATTALREFIIIFVIGGLLGTAFGVALGFFIFPYVFPPPPASETISVAEHSLVATGTFIHANPSDPVHWGKGRVSVYEGLVFLEADFEVGPGPAYHVYLVPKATIRTSSDLKGVKHVDLGGLRAFKGSQRYPIPAYVNLKDYPSVIIWCVAFGVLISPADLMAAR